MRVFELFFRFWLLLRGHMAQMEVRTFLATRVCSGFDPTIRNNGLSYEKPARGLGVCGARGETTRLLVLKGVH